MEPEHAEKLRDKIVECVGRLAPHGSRSSPYQQAFLAIAQALISPTSAKATLYALTAAKLLR